MTLIMVGQFLMMGLPGDAFFAMIGVVMGGGVPMGIALHMLTGLLIGLIFGAIVSSVGLLRLTSIGKGVGLGILAGIVAFVVLFLPVSMVVMPPAMVALLGGMQPQAPQQMVMQIAQAMMSSLLGGGFLLHLIYGAVLGSVVGYGLRPAPSSKYKCEMCGAAYTTEKDLMEQAKVHQKPNQQFACKACGGVFKSETELMDHAGRAHPISGPR